MNDLSEQGEELHNELLDFLSSHRAMTIATCNQGRPWAAAVYYANADLTFYYLSDPRSRHSRDIGANPSVALTINGESRDWRDIKGVQVDGRAELVPDGDEVSSAWRLYTAKYPFVEKWKVDLAGMLGLATVLKPLSSDASDLARRIGAVRFYRVTAERVLYTDNSRGFGHRHEFRPGPRNDA